MMNITHSPAGPSRGISPVRSWPLLVLAVPAAVAVWSGWVGIGQLTGFGVVRPLPGIWDSLRVDTAVTLPLGVEAYAAFALRAWLTGSDLVSNRTRQFARWSAIASLVLGMAGQIAYHLLAQSGTMRAPWAVTTLVSCLPVLVLGMGTALAHMLHADADDTARDRSRDMTDRSGPRAAAVSQPDQQPLVPDAQAGQVPHTGSPDQDWDAPVADQWTIAARPGPADEDHADQRGETGEPSREERMPGGETGIAMDALLAAGQRVSRRGLRAAGFRGSNAELGDLARRLRRERTDALTPAQQ